jgi:hypothetical protein
MTMDGHERELGELKAKVEGLQATFTDFREEMREAFRDLKVNVGARLDTHSRRINSLEKWRAWITGGLAVLAGLWGALMVWLKGGQQ